MGGNSTQSYRCILNGFDCELYYYLSMSGMVHLHLKWGQASADRNASTIDLLLGYLRGTLERRKLSNTNTIPTIRRPTDAWFVCRTIWGGSADLWMLLHLMTLHHPILAAETMHLCHWSILNENSLVGLNMFAPALPLVTLQANCELFAISTNSSAHKWLLNQET